MSDLERLPGEVHLYVNNQGQCFASSTTMNLAGPWSSTPEAAFVTFCEKARQRFGEWRATGRTLSTDEQLQFAELARWFV